MLQRLYTPAPFDRRNQKPQVSSQAVKLHRHDLVDSSYSQSHYLGCGFFFFLHNFFKDLDQFEKEFVYLFF